MGKGQPTLNFVDNVMPDGVNYEDLPVLEHQTEFVGSTDYLDGIKPHHLMHQMLCEKETNLIGYT